MWSQAEGLAARVEHKPWFHALVADDELPSLCTAHPVLGLMSETLAPGTADLKRHRF